MTVSAPVLPFSAPRWIIGPVFRLVSIVPVLLLSGYAVVSLIGRSELGVGGRLLRLILIVVVPISCVALCFVLRPAPQERNRRAQAHHGKH